MMEVKNIKKISPRKILALVVYLAAESEGGEIPTEQQVIHELVYKLKKAIPEVFDSFVFSEWYPFKWSYEVDQGLQSLMADDYISTPNPTFRRYIVRRDKIERDIINKLPEEIVNVVKQRFSDIYRS